VLVLVVEQVRPAVRGGCCVCVRRVSMRQGRPDILTCDQYTRENTGQYGIPNETAVFPRVRLFQGEFPSCFVVWLRPTKQTVTGIGPWPGACRNVAIPLDKGLGFLDSNDVRDWAYCFAWRS
jgi:hypothetical protein